tara:strand:+ start:625 stop:789 length:165 start_codon:yes stop_codon:yes gene_type:complete
LKKIKKAINKKKGINTETKKEVQSIMNTKSINISVTEVYTSGNYLIIVTNHPNE